jgi:hypothetical protein
MLRACGSCSESEDSSQLPQINEALNKSSSPRAHPPFEAFPSDSAVPASPPCTVFPHYSVSLLGLPLSLLLGASFLHVPNQSLPTASSHGIQFTSPNLRGLSRARVRCTDTSLPKYPCPLLPWASRAPVHRRPGNVRSNPNNRTETRPDAPTHPSYGSPRATRRTDTSPRPPRSQTPVPAEAVSLVQALGIRSTGSREYPPSPKREAPLTRLMPICSHRSAQPVTLR